MIASIAPSAAPDETPSVNGVASGLRSSAWNTTPAAARVAPTIAAASVRGSRAMKKICASGLSRNGMDVSNTRRSDTCVEPDQRRGDDGGKGRGAEDEHGQERVVVAAC